MRRFSSLLALLITLALIAPAEGGAVTAGHSRHKHAGSKHVRKKHRTRKRHRHRPARKPRPLASIAQPVSDTRPAPDLSAPSPVPEGQPPAEPGAEPAPEAEVAAEPTATPTPTATPDPRPFAPTSFWNARLADDAPLDDDSDRYVDRLHQLLDTHDPYVNTTRYSSPVYTVPADQPTVRVQLDQNNAGLQAAFEAVPIPDGAQPAVGTDGTMVVWQPETDTMWEFWIARHLDDGWHAVYGGKMTNVSRNPGYFLPPNSRWGATATSLPFLGGLMRLDELAAGRVDHALAMALPEIRAKVYSWPAQRTDGRSTDPDAIPEGIRFRIDPDLDLNTIRMAPIVRVMARAAQRYGIVVRDGGGAVAFYGEDPTPTARNPYAGPHGYFGGGYINEMLRDQFPWDHLQALKMQLRSEP